MFFFSLSEETDASSAASHPIGNLIGNLGKQLELKEKTEGENPKTMNVQTQLGNRRKSQQIMSN